VNRGKSAKAAIHISYLYPPPVPASLIGNGQFL